MASADSVPPQETTLHCSQCRKMCPCSAFSVNKRSQERLKSCMACLDKKRKRDATPKDSSVEDWSHVSYCYTTAAESEFFVDACAPFNFYRKNVYFGSKVLPPAENESIEREHPCWYLVDFYKLKDASQCREGLLLCSVDYVCRNSDLSTATDVYSCMFVRIVFVYRKHCLLKVPLLVLS
jgi:hypothetical protein